MDNNLGEKEEFWESSEDVEEYKKPRHIKLEYKNQGNNPICARCGTSDVCLICYGCAYWFCMNCACNYCSFCISCRCEHIKVFENGYRYKEKFIKKLGLIFFDSDRGLRK